jgi:hypothetical protein
MKRKFKKTGFILLICVLMTGGVYAQCGILYVYENDGFKQEFAVNEVQKLTFTELALVINKTDETTVSVDFANLRFFNLTEGNIPSGISSVSAQSEATAYFDASGNLVIKNTVPVNLITLFNLQGQKLQRTASSNTVEITLPATHYPAGIYVLQIADKNGIATKKLIKK